MNFNKSVLRLNISRAGQLKHNDDKFIGCQWVNE